MSDYDITQLTERSGVSRRNVHFYVQQGLLPQAIGAGLGARYGDEHLLRLQAIRLLRTRGLRLDEIRSRIEKMSLAELRRLLGGSTPAGRPKRGSDDIAVALEHLMAFGAAPHSKSPRAQRTEAVTRFRLAPGVELLVDERAGAPARARIAELIQSLSGILHGRRQNEKGEPS